MKIKLYLVLLFSLLLSSCTNEQSLQKYFVENAESLGPNQFRQLDIGVNATNLSDESKLENNTECL